MESEWSGKVASPQIITRYADPTDYLDQYPYNKVHGAKMGPTWGRQDQGGPHVSPMNLAIWVFEPWQ